MIFFVYGLTCLLFVLVAAELGTQPVMLFHEFTAELALDGFQPEELARRENRTEFLHVFFLYFINRFSADTKIFI